MSKEKISISSQKDKQQLALDLYLNTDKTQKEICELIGWNERTFSQNKAKYKWEELKSATQLTAQKITVNIYRRLEEATKEGTSLDPDKIIKLAKSIEYLNEKKTTVAQAINVFKEFTAELMAEDPEFAKKVNEAQKKYILKRINGE